MKLNFKNPWAILSLSLALVVMTGCDDDDPEPVNDEELITTVTVTFTNTADQSVVTATFRDTDGDGGNAPDITQPGALAADATYNVTIAFLDESDASDVEDITEEIDEEADEHQVFYVTSTGLNLTYAYGDTDGDQNPLGLVGTMTTGAASTGTLNIVLRHEPTKPNTGLGDAGGETDIDVTFNVTIQ